MRNLTRIIGSVVVMLSVFSLVSITHFNDVIVEGYQSVVSPLTGYPVSVMSPEQKISPALEGKISANPSGKLPVVIVLTGNTGGMAIAQQNTLIPTLQMVGFQVYSTTTRVANTISGTIPAKNIQTVAQNPYVQKILYDIPVKLMDPDSKLNVRLLKESVKEIGADKAWAQGYTGQGVTVFEIDSGIQNNHPALMRDGKSLVLEQFDVDPSFGDYTAPHGTHVAGIIASQDPEYKGVAPGIKGFVDIVAFDDTGASKLSWILKALEIAYNNADRYKPAVSTNSWGTFPDPSSPEENEIRQAVLKLATKMPVVFAAGNFGAPSTIAAPGDAADGKEDVITVAAVDNSGNIAPFSSRGPTNTGPYSQDPNEPDVAAPGVDITSTIPDGFASMSGTSMAAPHVAGVVALMLSKSPGLTNEECLNILTTTALDKGSPGFDYEYGAGVVQADRALSITQWSVVPQAPSPTWEVLSIIGIVVGGITMINPDVIISLINRRWFS